ncbi:hypothetical protein LT85_4976 [Collimonas arenae]|uniref:Uncharacterized protein n=1 Tax=Collimonas arenae TaxID=279058 RepID=A0A0A1FKD5_9BURK|nr:hypothetical protein LT85_4976 [Collimonas arenae]
MKAVLNGEGVLLDGWDAGCSGGMAIVSVRVFVLSTCYVFKQAAGKPTPGGNAGISCAMCGGKCNIAARRSVCRQALLSMILLAFQES